MSWAAMHRYVAYGIRSVACGVVAGPRHFGSPNVLFFLRRSDLLLLALPLACDTHAVPEHGPARRGVPDPGRVVVGWPGFIRGIFYYF